MEAGRSMLLEELEQVEATDGVGEVLPEGRDRAVSRMRSACSIKVLRAASISKGCAKLRRRVTDLPSPIVPSRWIGLYACVSPARRIAHPCTHSASVK